VEDIARGKHVDRVVRPRPGRTVLLRSDQRLLKIKGLVGVRAYGDSGQHLLVAPQPQRQYRDRGEYHLHLRPDLAIEPKLGRRKYLFALGLSAAEREFSAQMRLAVVGIGLPPLAAFRLLDIRGDSILDGDGEPTGAVMLGWEDGLTLLSSEIYGYGVWDRPSRRADTIRRVVRETDYLHELRALVARTYDSVGTCRGLASLRAGVLRHAGHLENFAITPDGRALMFDTDTCCLMDELPENERAPLLLRDMLSDILRMISTISILHWNRSFREAIVCEAFDPFSDYLRGYFRPFTSLDLVLSVARHLSRDYVAWLCEYERFLQPIAAAFVADWDATAPHRTLNGSKWRRIHTFFAPSVLRQLYFLLEGSPALRSNCSLPRVDVDRMESLWIDGVNTFVRRATRR
jgi:hypothetical protein